jgi:RNA polymerase sigma factor (sigma-70 family)
VSALFGRTTSDEQLGRHLAQGEAPAFDELYRRYAHRLAAYGTHLLGDAAAGDDVAQVALMRAYQALREGRVPDALGAWLYRIAHNAAIDAIRHRRELPTELVPEHGREQRAGEVGALTAAIAALPERQRKVFVLRELHGLRIGEAAGELGLSNAQVEQALFAARNRLAEQLVFGERLSCSAVQRLAAGPLDVRERRALKTHVRSCPACRKQLGVRGVALSLLPFPSFGLLRAAPLPTKVAAVAAAAVVGAAIPLAGIHGHESLPVARASAAGPDVPLQLAPTVPAAVAAPKVVAPPRAKAKPTRRPTAPAPRFVPVAPASPVVHIAPVVHRRAKHGKASDGGGGMTVAVVSGPRTSMDGRDSGQTTTEPASALPAVTAAIAATTTDSSGDGGGGSDGGSGDSGDSGSNGGGSSTTSSSSEGG